MIKKGHAPTFRSTRTRPDLIDISVKTELLTFILTFLSSTWYIKNPFLKSKLLQVRIAQYLVG